MLKWKSPCLIAVALFVAGVADAQTVKLSDSSSFSEEALLLDFESLRNGAGASEIYSAWGVNFFGSPPATPEIETVLAGFGGAFNNVLANHSEGSSSGLGLGINFKFPVRRVGFTLTSGTGATTATLTAFDAFGNELGTVEQAGIATPTFFGIETMADGGIAKIVLSYGASELEEQLDDLILDYVERPMFETVLAQVGDGVIPNVGALQTIIVIANLTNSTADGVLSLFESDGDPLALEINGEMSSEFEFSLPPFASMTFTTSGTSPAATAGYALISSAVPVESTGIFRILNMEGDPLSEGGVASAVGKPFQVGVVQKALQGNFDSGIAAVNVSGSASNGRIELVDETGTVVAVDEDLLDLGPGEHVAKFLSEIFAQLADQDFRGTLVITSDKRMAIVILRTANGLVISSLPLGSTQR